MINITVGIVPIKKTVITIFFLICGKVDLINTKSKFISIRYKYVNVNEPIKASGFNTYPIITNIIGIIIAMKKKKFKYLVLIFCFKAR